MADRTDKHPLNAPGTYYNDNSCIDCDVCREMAPAIFRRDDESGASYVWRQPQSLAELALAREAMENCPTETIGCDG
ncbi:ferredoxin [Haloferula sp. BvORR071]|uniref:ferredoxin n=1 Tax=Haloferula sp. BvORR071 TaxID=1396141 RepID=UPI0005533B9B|nr:ferredoxin [Haloferula sp. BvORR071]